MNFSLILQAKYTGKFNHSANKYYRELCLKNVVGVKIKRVYYGNLFSGKGSAV